MIPALSPTQRFGGWAVTTRLKVRLTRPRPPLHTTRGWILASQPTRASTPVSTTSTTTPRAWEKSRGCSDQSRVISPNQQPNPVLLAAIVDLATSLHTDPPTGCLPPESPQARPSAEIHAGASPSAGATGAPRPRHGG